MAWQISDYHTLPDTGHMAEDLRVYLQENEEIPQDITSLFVIKHFQFDNESLPSVIKLVLHLGMKCKVFNFPWFTSLWQSTTYWMNDEQVFLQHVTVSKTI